MANRNNVVNTTEASGGWLRAMFLLLFALTAGWSSRADAQSVTCDLQAVNPTAQTGIPGSVLTFQYAVVEGTVIACNTAGMDGEIVISDGSGPISTTPFTAQLIGTYSFNVTLPATPGTLTIQINCLANCDTVTTLKYNAVAANVYTLETVPVSGSASGNVGASVPLTVQMLKNGSPYTGGATVTWSTFAPGAVTPTTSVTDGSGLASTSFSATSSGSYTVDAQVCDPDIFAACSAITAGFDISISDVFTLTATTPTSFNVSTGQAADLGAKFLVNGAPLPGTGITWSVAPAGGTLGTGTVLDITGTGTNTFSSATPGTYIVTATSNCGSLDMFCPPATLDFTVVVDVPPLLTIVSGNNQTLTTGTPSAPLVVKLTTAGGTPIAGATINWSAGSGTLAAASSITNAQGQASNTLTVSNAGQAIVTAVSPMPLSSSVSFKLNAGLSNLPGLNPTQSAMANAIDHLCPALANQASLSAGQQDLLADCQGLLDAAGLDPDAVIDALDQLFPHVAQLQTSAGFNAAQSQFQNLKARIAALRSGTQGKSFGGLALNTATGTISLGSLFESLTANEEPAGEVGADFSRWGFYVAGTIGRGEAKPGQVNPAYDFDINGLTAGIDYRKSDKLIIGGAVGYTKQDSDLVDTEGTLSTKGWSVSGYTTYYHENSWYTDAVLTYGHNNYDLMRRILYTIPKIGGGSTTIDQTARSSSGGSMLEGAFTFGHDFQKGAWSIGPYARMLYTRLSFDQITEKLDAGPGSGLGLVIQNRDVTSLASQIGTKFAFAHSTNWGVLMPHLQIEWEHEFKDDPSSMTARFLNDPTNTPIVITGDRIDKDYFRVGLGLSMVMTHGRSGFMYFEKVISRDGISQYNLALGLRLEF